MQLAQVILRARFPDKLARFYEEHLGMAARTEHDALILGYGGADAVIELQEAASGESYLHARTDRYWKIGITLPNVDMARAQLVQSGITVSDPVQFNDIGYMCHLSDPEGFSIELLQHRFLGNRCGVAGNSDELLGGGARIGQITLRSANIEQALAFYQGRLGMQLLSIQPVEAYGFTLYFLAFTDERPPNADLKAVENREWLWQRPYTTLELQVFDNGMAGMAGLPGFPGEDEPGFGGIAIQGGGSTQSPLRDEAGGIVDLID